MTNILLWSFVLAFPELIKGGKKRMRKVSRVLLFVLWLPGKSDEVLCKSSLKLASIVAGTCNELVHFVLW